MIKILIADDHELVRRGLKQLLQEKFAISYIEEATNGEELIHKAMKEIWHIVISDITMPGINGIQALKEIKQNLPTLPVLILSSHPAEQYASRVLKAGASGYLSKDVAIEELAKAVDVILQGRKYISPKVLESINEQNQVKKHPPLHEVLSQREFDVLKMLADGKSLTEIAAILSIGITTVSTYRSRVLEKMGMQSNSDLTRYVIENRL